MQNEGERLERRLVEAALGLLADRPAERLSLRAVAQEVGVSHQAPYVHFGTKRRFLAAVAGVGLDGAADRATAAVAGAGDEPETRLHALVDAYVAFIRDQPHVHDLAYGPLVAKADHPWLQRAAIRNWDLLHDTVAACQPSAVGEADVLRRATVLWGAVYGIARLSALAQVPVSVPDDGHALAHQAVTMLHHGWQAT